MSETLGFNRYRPYTPQQLLFHKERYITRYRLISAGTRGGKTYTGVFEGLYWAFKYPNQGDVRGQMVYHHLLSVGINEL